MPTDDPQWTCTSPWHQVAGQATHSRLFLSTWCLQFLLLQCSAVPLLLLSYLFTTFLDIVVAPASGGPHTWWAYRHRVEAGTPLGVVSDVAMVAGGSPGALCLPVLHGVTAGRPLGVYYLTYF